MSEFQGARDLSAAVDWFAVYRPIGADGLADRRACRRCDTERVACWAVVDVLIASKWRPLVVGMVEGEGFLEPAETVENFAHYRHISDLPEHTCEIATQEASS